MGRDGRGRIVRRFDGWLTDDRAAMLLGLVLLGCVGLVWLASAAARP